MIDLKTVIEVHTESIDNFGGSEGVRSWEGLESAIARPYMTFDSVELYPHAEDKAAAIFESIIINHPFIDGNKRTAFVMLKLFLMEADPDISGSNHEKYEMTIAASKGELDINAIRFWIKERLIPIAE